MPTVDSQDVAELLEQEEKRALEKKRAKTHDSDPAKPTENGNRDPRRRGGDKDKYSDEREANDERRSRRSKELVSDEDMRKVKTEDIRDVKMEDLRDVKMEDLKDVKMEDVGRDSDKASANGSVRSRRRSRSPRARRSPRDRDAYRDRDYDRRDPRNSRLRDDDDRRSHRPRHSVDHDDDDRYYRPGKDDRHDRDRREPRDRRDREIDRAYGSRRDDRRDDDRRDRQRRTTPPKRKSPEPTDDERDRRTVFVQQLAARLRTKELQAFFEAVGPVVEAQIVKDRVSGRSKGVGYVEFKDEESVQKAIQLTGQKLLGIPIIAQLTEAEKNRQARHTEGTATQSNGIPFHRLYVGNIHFSITEDDLKNVFEPFGELEFVQLQKEEQGRSKGYGFVQFIDPAQAKEALEKMNGFELAGRPIRVGLGNDKFTPESTQSLLQRFASQGQAAAFQGSSFSGMGGRGAHAGGQANFDRASGRDADKTGGASALDDTDVAGVNFSNYSRDALMRKLARTDDSEEKVAPKTMQKKPTGPVDQPAPSRCVLLKNVYNQAEETEPGWQKELEEDVKVECDEKYGQVVHIGLALDNNDGEIYIKFDRKQGGENAIRGLNGRMYGGRMITAQYVVDAVYNMNFPKAANL
ncbi:hypothetical protein BAUCODRAFT_38330 [Baudoinia panamericana UAMH 10762]|uniref:RRM domain-containing protein n=1 Tax=Baudoinia panamericana (strain UAMH 10762) TaxID=717646 RepID=M2N042_BAUPA|nr:uncharacterized protein BAUCODRAFT_38330 [Baudoinia panamericana UAMH 10762]EMC92299.1 hypothetical protein BAUCODRAFT_38330 [Baudoinia panamericana UAMH 10762]